MSKGSKIVALAEAYNLLECERGVHGEAEVRKAYYRLSRQWHPDKCSLPDAQEMSAVVNNAYELIKASRDFDEGYRIGEFPLYRQHNFPHIALPH